MKHKLAAKMLSLLLAVVLCATAFAVPAFASGGDESITSTVKTEPTEAADEGTADIQFQIPDEFLDMLLSLLGSLGTSSEEETEVTRTDTVTTNGGKLNVRTGAGLDNYAFTQLPNGTTVEVIGQDGDWYMIRLPEKIGYVYSGYMTLGEEKTDTSVKNDISLNFDLNDLSALWALLMGSSEDVAESGGLRLTPDGNLNLIDDIGSTTASGKQFITVETKTGNVFYLIIDRDDEGTETVYFLNQVDEADLLALMGDDAPTTETPAVCTCSEKCVAGDVNNAQIICENNLPASFALYSNDFKYTSKSCKAVSLSFGLQASSLFHSSSCWAVRDVFSSVRTSSGVIWRTLQMRRMVSVRILTVPRSISAYVRSDRPACSATSAWVIPIRFRIFSNLFPIVRKSKISIFLPPINCIQEL